MKKKMKKTAIIMISVSVLLTGCGKGCEKGTEDPAEGNRFETIYEQGSIADEFMVVIDRETGVNYLVRKIGAGNSSSIAMCVLLDAEGKPVITEKEGKKQ